MQIYFICLSKFKWTQDLRPQPIISHLYQLCSSCAGYVIFITMQEFFLADFRQIKKRSHNRFAQVLQFADQVGILNIMDTAKLLLRQLSVTESHSIIERIFSHRKTFNHRTNRHELCRSGPTAFRIFKKNVYENISCRH